MGMFANFADVHHPTPEWELGDCTACWNTGWETYPINVSVGEDDVSPCPYGCAPPEDREGYYTDYEPEIDLADQLDAWYASRQPVVELDPFLILSRATTKAGLKPYTGQSPAAKQRGLVSSDVDLMGLVEDHLHKEGDNLLVYPATIPAYLAGTPLSLEDGVLRVQYEYLGSTLVVRYGPVEASMMRFAYSWDLDFATHAV